MEEKSELDVSIDSEGRIRENVVIRDHRQVRRLAFLNVGFVDTTLMTPEEYKEKGVEPQFKMPVMLTGTIPYYAEVVSEEDAAMRYEVITLSPDDALDLVTQTLSMFSGTDGVIAGLEEIREAYHAEKNKKKENDDE